MIRVLPQQTNMVLELRQHLNHDGHVVTTQESRFVRRNDTIISHRIADPMENTMHWTKYKRNSAMDDLKFMCAAVSAGPVWRSCRWMRSSGRTRQVLKDLP